MAVFNFFIHRQSAHFKHKLGGFQKIAYVLTFSNQKSSFIKFVRNIIAHILVNFGHLVA